VGLMKAGACERSEVRAGITKVREDFFDTKFHDGTQARESHTRHNNLTAPRVLCNNTLQQER
jgi:hypothetical protein